MLEWLNSKKEMSSEKSELEKEVTCGVILMCVFNGCLI